MKLDVWICQPIGVHGFQSLWTQTDKHTHTVVSKVTSSCPQTLHITDRVRNRQWTWQTSSTVVTSLNCFWAFLSKAQFSTFFDSFVLSSRQPYSQIYIINVMWQCTICNARLVSLHDGHTTTCLPRQWTSSIQHFAAQTQWFCLERTSCRGCVMNESLQKKKSWDARNLTSCANVENIAGGLFSLGLQGGLCNNLYTHTDSWGSVYMRKILKLCVPLPCE